MNMSSAKKRRTETTEDRLEDLDTTENTAEVNETSMMSLTIPRVETAVSSEVPASTTGMSELELVKRRIAIIELILFERSEDENIAWSEIETILLNKGYTKQEFSIFRYGLNEKLYETFTSLQKRLAVLESQRRPNFAYEGKLTNLFE